MKKKESRRHVGVPRSKPLALAFAAAALTLGAASPSAALGPSEVAFQVRPGTVIRACGGIAGSCEAWLLSGTLAFTADPPRLTASDLAVRPLGGSGRVPFPSQGDVRLTELEADRSAAGLRFESAPGALQTVSLELTPFGDLDGTPDGYFLQGTYDEGCCDRFVLAFGTVPLLPIGDEGFLELREGRFRLRATYRDLDGTPGAATPVPLDAGSGWFWFFEPQNPELFVKVLDACGAFGRYWVFVAGLTDLAVDVEVFDLESDFALVYENPPGEAFETVVDTEGFPCEGRPEAGRRSAGQQNAGQRAVGR